MLRIEAISGADNESDRVTDVFAISITNNRRTDCSSDNESDYSPSNIITNYSSDNIAKVNTFLLLHQVYAWCDDWGTPLGTDNYNPVADSGENQPESAP